MLKTIFRQKCLNKVLSTSCQCRSFILGIETSCDDSGAAVLDKDGNVVSEALSTQLSAKFGGVIPSFAMNRHAQQIPIVVENCLKDAGLESAADVEVIAVTNRPGLSGSLRKGTNYAKYLCTKYKKPMIPIHHMEAHATTVRLTNKEIKFPYLVLLISGGHSMLAMAQDIDEFTLLGTSIDNSPGECFDKTARRLKLHVTNKELSEASGGKAIEVMGRGGDPLAVTFPSPLGSQRNCMFSFGGLRTQAEYFIKALEEQHSVGPDELIPNVIDFCASFELAIARHLCHRTQRAIEFVNQAEMWGDHGVKQLVASGGVACNNRIRASLQKVCDEFGCELVLPPPKYCTDNGVMIGWNGYEKWQRQKEIVPWQDVFDVDIHPRSPFGTDLCEEVNRAQIRCSWVKLT